MAESKDKCTCFSAILGGFANCRRFGAQKAFLFCPLNEHRVREKGDSGVAITKATERIKFIKRMGRMGSVKNQMQLPGSTDPSKIEIRICSCQPLLTVMAPRLSCKWTQHARLPNRHPPDLTPIYCLKEYRLAFLSDVCVGTKGRRTARTVPLRQFKRFLRAPQKFMAPSEPSSCMR